MYSLLTICLCLYKIDYSYAEDAYVANKPDNLTIPDVTDALLNIFGTKDENSATYARLKELKEKLQKIDSYAIDKDKYYELIMNETKHSNLNATNFYTALLEKDYFQNVMNDTQSLFLNLKMKMNRDDIVRILAEKGEGSLKKSARRMLGDEDDVPKKRKFKKFDEVVDKYIAGIGIDEHRFDENDRYNKYFDPKTELEERKEYHKHDGRRIYKGERTTVRYYPFMVSVHVMGRFWCGGSIYWNDLILTSASCLQLLHNNRFYHENPKVLHVRVGSNHSRVGGEVIEALEVYFHPSYNPKTLNHNIAIIRLRRQIQFTYHRVPKLIRISHNDMGLSYTSEIVLLGWGVSKASQKMTYEPKYLQRKVLPIFPASFCKEIYGDKYIQQTMFCAGTMSTGEGPCDHDAGGPAIMDGILIGIISFGPAICGFRAPAVFTLVGAHADWIETVNETMPHYYRGKSRTTTTTEFSFIEFFQTETTEKKRKATTKAETETTQATEATETPTTNKALRNRYKTDRSHELIIFDDRTGEKS